MASQNVDLTFRANISQLTADLAAIPNITAKEAKKMVKELNSQLVRAEKAAKKAGKGGAKNFGDFQDKVGTTDSVLQALSGSIDGISPKMASLTRVTGDAAGSLEGLLRATAGLKGKAGAWVAGGTAVLAAGWAAVSFQQRQANEEIERSRKEMNAQLGLMEQVRQAQIMAAVAAGEMTQVEASQIANAKTVNDLFIPRIAALKEERRELDSLAKVYEDINEERPFQRIDELITGQLDPSDLFEAWANPIKSFSDVAEERVAEADIKIRSLDDQINILERSSDKMLATLNRGSVASFSGSLGDAEDSTKALADAQAELDAILQDAESSALTGITAIRFARDQELAEIDALVAANEDLHNVEAARSAVSAKFWQQEKAELDRVSQSFAQIGKQLDEVVEKIREDMKKAITDVVGGVADMAGASSDIFGVIADQRVDDFESAKQALFDLGDDATQAERDAALDRVKAEKAEAKKAWFIAQDLAMSEALINGAVAVTAAWATGPIAGPILAAAAAATTAAQVAIIAGQQPSFHQGGIVGDPSQRPAILRTGEGVLTAQGVNAAGGPEGLAALNRGSGTSGPLRVELRVGNNVAQELVYAGTQGPGRGRRATQALRSSGRVNPYRRAL